jgi:hypothetical protein
MLNQNKQYPTSRSAGRSAAGSHATPKGGRRYESAGTARHPTWSALLDPAKLLTGTVITRPGTVPVLKVFCPGQGVTAIAVIEAPMILIGFPGVFVAVEIGVTVSPPLTQTVLPSWLIAR